MLDDPTGQLGALLRKLQSLPPETQARALANFQRLDPELYGKLTRYLNANRGFIDEAQGSEHWLRKFGPHTFTGSFASFHTDFWSWYWPLAVKLRQGKELDSNDLVALLPWPRDSGKSSHSEWSAIAEGCLVRKGYVLWVSGKLDLAIEHVVSIRDRIESEQIGRVYPHMSKPKVGAHGNKFGWGRDFLMTGDARSGNSWAVRPAGLNEAMRGGKVLDMRPTLIVLSDVDEIGDSIMVVEQKEMLISRSILPMGSASTRVIFDQNPIHANSVMNRILTRTSSVLSVRRVIGGGPDGKPVPAFKDDLVIEFEQTEHGPRHIIKSGTPTWSDMDVRKCQVFLDRSGIEAFLAEYQHSLEISLEERVLPEYDDRILRSNVISWSQYEAMYGTRRIPSHWSVDLGLDIGYTKGHRTAFTFLARAPEGVKLSGAVFRYRGCMFTATTIGDMSNAVRALMWPDEKVQREFMSHEAAGERLVLNQKHGWHFMVCDSKKTAGIPQWRHMLRSDRSKPHPFHRDEKGLDGLWKIGCPAWFDVVEDSQLFAPTDDRGLKVHRDQAFTWRMKPVKQTESGVTVEQPMKADEDSCDATRMCTAAAGFGPTIKSMNTAQKIQSLIPEQFRRAELAKTDVHPNQQFMTSNNAEFLARRQFKLKAPPLCDQFGQPIR